MRSWKNWLIPLLTCLTVSALALLPPHLSGLRDRGLTGTVHAEPLAEDSNFPFEPPDLMGRVWLLAQWREAPESVILMMQDLEHGSPDWESASAAGIAELESLLEEGVLSLEEPELPADFSSIYRLYLRDPADLSSASFWMLETYDKRTGSYWSLSLDAETGRALALGLTSAQLRSHPLDIVDVGTSFLARLSLPCEAEEAEQYGYDGYSSYLFHLADHRTRYHVLQIREGLDILPYVDWARLEDGQAVGGVVVDTNDPAAYGYPSSSVDAGW